MEQVNNTNRIAEILNRYELDVDTKISISVLIKQYETASYTDFLTGAYNKRFLIEKLDVMANFCVCMIDINNFKKINDTVGHVDGDIILTEISCILRNAISKTDYLVRFGGDEFVIIMPSKSVDYALQKINHIKLKIYEKYCDSTICPTISYGIAYSDKEVSVIDIIRRADEDMYKSRNIKLTRKKSISV